MRITTVALSGALGLAVCVIVGQAMEIAELTQKVSIYRKYLKKSNRIITHAADIIGREETPVDQFDWIAFCAILED